MSAGMMDAWMENVKVDAKVSSTATEMAVSWVILLVVLWGI